MPNPLYNQLRPQPQGNNPMLQQIMNFKKTFSGNPQQMVQQMINSGRISQTQINQLAQQADEIYKQMKGFL